MKEQDIMTATQAELDATAYDAYVRNGESKAAAGRELGLNPSTVSDRIKRHLARVAQDEASEPEQTEAERLTAKYGAMDSGAKAEAQRLSSKYSDLPDPVHHGAVFARIEASNPDMRFMDETVAAFADTPQTEDPDESLVALLEEGEPETAATVDGTVVAMTRRIDITGQDDDTGELTARPGPGQAEDNIVHEMACGHEYDSPVELAPGQSVQCSAHGQTEIAGGQEPVPAPQPASAKASRFPEGVVTPSEFRAALVTEGIVPEKSVRYLGYKLANENPDFPARWYAKDGTSYAYDDRQSGARLGIHMDGGREWVKNQPAKSRQPRTPKVVLFEDGKPAERLVALLGGADLAVSDVAALYAAYAAQRGQAGTLQGFTGWLVAEGASWLSEAAPRLAEAS